MVFSISAFTLFASLNWVGIFLAPLLGTIQLNSAEHFVHEFPKRCLTFKYKKWSRPKVVTEGLYKPCNCRFLPDVNFNSYFIINSYLIRMVTKFIQQIMHVPRTDFLTLVALHVLLTMGYFCFNFTNYIYLHLSEYPFFKRLLNSGYLTDVFKFCKLVYASLLELTTMILCAVQIIEITLTMFNISSPWFITKMAILPLEIFVSVFQLLGRKRHTFNPYFNWWLWTILNTIICGLAISGLIEAIKTFLVIYEVAGTLSRSPVTLLKQRYYIDRDVKSSKKKVGNSQLLLKAVLSTKVLIQSFVLKVLHYLHIFELWLYKLEFSKILWASFSHEFYIRDEPVTAKTVSAQVLGM